MDDFFAKLVLALAVTSAVAPQAALADASDDQYAVAAGHYARDRWQLAIDEFEVFRRDHPRHPKVDLAVFFQAEAHLQLEQFDNARRLFREFLRRDPQSRYRRQALFRVGESSYLLGEHASARQELAEFRDQYPEDRLNAFVLTYLGEIELAAEQWQRAARHFQRCLQEFPDGRLQDDCRFGLARALEEQGDADEASRLYLALSAKTSAGLADDALLRLAAIKYAAGEYEETLSTLEEFEKTYPRSPLLDRVQLSRGWAYYRLDRFDDARKAFASLEEDEEVEVEARFWLGMTAKALKQWSAAAEKLQAIADRNPKHELAAEARFHAGDAWRRGGKFAEALRQFQKVERGSAWADDSLLGQLQVAWQQRRHEGVDQLAQDFAERFADSTLHGEVRRIEAQSLLARKEFRLAAKLLEPLAAGRDGTAAERDSNQYLLGLAYQGLERHEEALQLLEPLAQRENPLVNDARKAQATILIATSRFADAIAPLAAFLEQDPHSDAADQCRAQLVVCYGRTGQLDKAQQAWQALIDDQAEPSLVDAATQHLAESYYAAGNYAKAAPLFERLVSRPDVPEVVVKGLSGLGWSLYKLERFASAADVFQRLIDEFPDHRLAPESALLRGQICERLEQFDGALEMYRLVLDEYSRSEQLPQALLAAARIHDKHGRDSQADELYARLEKDFSQHPFADAVLYERAWVLRDLDRSAESMACFEKLHANYPESRYWSDATFRLAEHAYAGKRFREAELLVSTLTERRAEEANLPHVLFLQGQVAAGLENWDLVIAAMQRLAKEHPQHPLAALAQYWAAEAKYRQGDYRAAGKQLDELATELAGRSEPWMAMVVLRRAQVMAHARQWMEAQELATTIADRFPDFDQQYEADYVIGRALASRGEFEAARAAYQKVIRSATGGKTETAAMAQWMIGESYFHQKNYDAALREYLRLEILYAYPTWQAAALLQAGKCQEHLGQWKQAAELYDRLVKEYPSTSFVDEAQRRLKSAQERISRNT